MSQIIREGAKLGDQELIIETGRMAMLANGSVVIQYGESQVLCTAVAGEDKSGLGFFPLTVNYQENHYAAGQIPGNYFRREAKPTTKATLASRLIDRPCRPLFADGYMCDTQLIAWVISADRINDTDVLGITGCSAALMLSDIPWNGPLAGVRVGRIDGKFVANPTIEQRERSEMDIVLAISPDAIVMVEGEANVVAEDIMIDALAFGQEAVQDVLKLQLDMAERLGKKKMEVTPTELNPEFVDAIREAATDKIKHAVQIKDKKERGKTSKAIRNEIVEKLAEERFPEQEDDLKAAFGKVRKEISRRMVIETGHRIDGRKPDEIRNITCDIGLVPRAHGSALFTRGETQALVVTTLGTDKDSQRIDGLEGEENKTFMLHYNFPPFCVGEVRFMRATSRRELGHGMLAERALVSSIPCFENEFPYTVRIVSDVLGSNGSSSMASVCGGSLALMDAGVPVKHATAGIAMGLIKEGDDIVVLSDILGDEDHFGDMDFKVCGTADGITAFQMDTKIAGISFDTMKEALAQATRGIKHILGEMNKAINTPRTDLAPNAPRIEQIKIPVDAIGAVIGPGGKNIRSIQETTNTVISIEDDGTVNIASSDAISTQQAIEIIKGLTATPEVGEIYLGTVQKIVDFGAFIQILPGKDGLCHISELTEGRVNRVEDVLSEGEEVYVKVLEIERNGKIRLSRRAAMEERAEADTESE